MGEKDNKKYDGKKYISEIKRKEKNKELLNKEIDRLRKELNSLKNKYKDE